MGKNGSREGSVKIPVRFIPWLGCGSRFGGRTAADTLSAATALPGLVILVAMIAVGSGSSAFAQSRATNLDAYLTLSNDYRSRGLSQLESGVSWQIGADYEHASGFFAGGLVANVEYATEWSLENPREYVVDYYAGYAWGRRGWKWNVALGRYLYPDVDVDYDYSELRFGAAFMDRFFYNATYTDRLYSLPYAAWHHELGVVQPLPWNLEFSAAVGRNDISNGLDYTHWNVGLSKVLRRVGVDLRFYESNAGYVSHLGSPEGNRWVLSVSCGFPARN
jgi:uncharacterized protein (TIGR02001 family)